MDSWFEDYSFDEDGLLRYQNRIVVLDREGLQKVFCTPFSRHPGVNKMMADLRPLYFWSGLKWDVIEYVAQFSECQHVKAKYVRLIELLYPHEIP